MKPQMVGDVRGSVRRPRGHERVRFHTETGLDRGGKPAASCKFSPDGRYKISASGQSSPPVYRPGLTSALLHYAEALVVLLERVRSEAKDAVGRQGGAAPVAAVVRAPDPTCNVQRCLGVAP